MSNSTHFSKKFLKNVARGKRSNLDYEKLVSLNMPSLNMPSLKTAALKTASLKTASFIHAQLNPTSLFLVVQGEKVAYIKADDEFEARYIALNDPRFCDDFSSQCKIKVTKIRDY